MASHTTEQSVATADSNPVVRFGRFLRRRWWRLRRRWALPKVRFVHHKVYAGTLEGAPVDPLRGQKILGFLVDEGLLDRDDISVPRRPAVRSLLRVHDPDYIEAVGHDPEVTERIFGERVSDEDIEYVVEMQRVAAGGTIQATRLALQGRSVAVNVGGGFHHASPYRRRRILRSSAMILSAFANKGSGTLRRLSRTGPQL